MTRYKVDISAIVDANEPSPQTVVLVNSDGDRQFLHLKGCSEIAFRGGLDFTSELIAGMRHFHLASLFVVPHLRTQAPSMLRNARTAGLTTSLDTCWDPQGEWMQVLAPCLPELDILFMNEDEMGQICAGRTIVDASREMISMGAAMVVMKNGQRGCLVRTQDGEIICPAYDVLARDTTGAGDCFVAGFLAAHLRGATPDCAGLMGNAAGGLSVQHIGAVEGLLSRADLEEWMSRTKLRSLQT